ncbi:YitT family protein [Dethiothermospora halolimnae]|uniref:YitT family protein n=1 Tax=Dethiothermospora halolimnae TaxID=3114390 RepID=UPI003CCBE600
MKSLIKDYTIITLGVIIVALGLCFFLVPADLAVGGVTGFAMVFNNIFPVLSIGSLMFILNILLFIVAFILIGPQFGAKTIYASFALSGAIWAVEKLFPLADPLTDDMILNLFFGILIQGIGMAVIFYQNASTGGTDIIAKIFNKFFHIEIGKGLLLADFFITLMAGLTFGLELGLYALLGVIMNAFVIDNVIEGLDLKMSISIVSQKPEEIKSFINNSLSRGATIYHANGAYTNKEKKVITTVVSRREFIRLKTFIKETDDKAFVMVAHVKEVLGEGFSIV